MKSAAALKQIANNEIAVADFVPFGSHIAPDVIKLKDGKGYLACWRLEGITFETAEFEELNARKDALNNFLRTLGGGEYAVWSHKLRRVVHDRLEGHFTNRFCEALDSRYQESFVAYKMMATELYVSVIYRPTVSAVMSVFKRASKRTPAEIEQEQRECLDHMDDVSKQVASSLAKYRPERLRTYDRHGTLCSEMAAFLGYLLNGVWEEMPVRRAEVAAYLPSSRLHFGDRNGMLQIEHPDNRKFVGFLDFQEYPRFSETGMNNGILYGEYEYIETQSFSIINKMVAVERLTTQRNHLESGGEGSATEITEMAEAIDQVQAGAIELGEYHYSLAVFGETLDATARNLAEARATFDGPGFKMSVVDLVPECAWFAQLPGNWWLRPREANITSFNFACLSPFHNFATGKRRGNPWGDAVALLKTPSGQPFYFNFHASPDDTDNTNETYPGNTTVLGFTGSGKTTAVAFLLAQTDKVNARLVAFDKDRGLEILIRAMGGKYRTFKRGEATGINPFQWPDTPSNRALCEQVVQLCMTSKGGAALTPSQFQAISAAVATVFTLPQKMRRLGAVDQVLPNVGEESLRVRLKPWIGNNSLGWVVDNPVDTLDLHSARKFGFDYTEFLDDAEVRPVVMLMLLHATQSLIDGTPFIYLMEEFWKPLMDDIFSDFALNKQKTIRKEGGLGVFITQSPSDVLNHSIAKTMVEQSVTLLCLPNPRADRDDYVNGFKLTLQEFNIVRNLPEEGRMFLVKQGQRSAIVKLDLGGMTNELIVLSGSVDNVLLLDGIRAQVGDDADVWLPLLYEAVAARRATIKRSATATLAKP